MKRAGNVYGMSWLPGIARSGQPERAEEARSLLVLVAPAAVRQVAARDHELGLNPLHQRSDRALHRRVLARAEMQVGDVEDACHDGRGRLYSESNVTERSPEVFDDLYLGLRAGGAMRKQRRGEPLTAEEQEALGRWQRLSRARKSLAIGAFAIGTFGLGFTLGGLIFGRWRRA